MDLDLSRVEALRGRGVVGIGKHLCGAATDFALRSIVSALHSDVSGRGLGMRVCGLGVALCCHHRCSWEQLAGRDFLAELGFSAQDFHLISHMTSWAVCGQRPAKEGVVISVIIAIVII